MFKKFLWSAFSLIATAAYSEPLEVGQKAKNIVFEGELGSKLDGASWATDSLTGHVTSLFYIDPEEKGKNEPLEKLYEREKFPFDVHKTVAVINMAAAWYPNSMIENVLAQKQKQYSNTLYVRDKKKSLVKVWGLQDDAVNLVVFNREGTVIYIQRGQVPESAYPVLVKTIRDALALSLK